MTLRETCFLCFSQHGARFWKCLWDYFGLSKWKAPKTFSRSYLQSRKIEKRRQKEFLTTWKCLSCKKCEIKNIRETLACGLCATSLFLPHLTSSVWCPMSDVQCPMSHVWCPMSDVRFPMCDVCFPMSDTRYLMSYVLCGMSDVWFVMSVLQCPSDVRIWCPMSDFWWLMSDVRFPMSDFSWCLISDFRCLMCDVSCVMSDGLCSKGGLTCLFFSLRANRVKQFIQHINVLLTYVDVSLRNFALIIPFLSLFVMAIITDKSPGDIPEYIRVAVSF